MGVIALLVLIFAAGWVVLPFVAATVWATMIVIATWPMLLAVQRRLGGRRGPAVAVMVLVLLAVLVAPIWMAIVTLDDNVALVVEKGKLIFDEGLPVPPDWIESIPLVGPSIAEPWRELAGDPAALSGRVQP